MNNSSDIKNTRFAHLHVHTQYSLLDGAIRIDNLLQKAKEFGMGAVAITDHGTMFGTIEFYEKALKAGIKPLIGCECYVAPRTLADKTVMDKKGLRHLVLLAENMEGYRNLCKLASIAQLKGFYYKPRIDREVLKKHHKGLIALTACLHGEIPHFILEGKQEQADETALFYRDLFGEDRFYLEIQHNGMKDQETVNEAIRDMSDRLSIPMVATNDCHYLDREDVKAHDVLLCIQTGKTVNDADRFRFRTDELYFKSPDEMIAAFSGFPGAIENTLAIAERCHIEFDFNTYHFPQFNTGSDESVEELFDRKVREGFEERWKKIRERRPDAEESVYRERLEYEIDTIKKMQFPGYFLIVSDFISFAKNNQVPVGPGRGSAAGSIVAYSLGITDLDPIANGLIFERFLNPARISMPDIDVDFCINGREKVFHYVVDRYGGGDYVAQIITFGKLKTRAVIRDVGRALDIPLREVDAIAKMVPDVLNISLDDALNMEPKLKELAETKEEIRELIRICRVLEGLPRHASTHAAGVVIGDKPLVEYVPLFRGKKGEVVTQFDMKIVEKIGLVKFDFLGLRNLTVIQDTLALIESGGKTPPNLSDLPLDDEDTYRLLSSGDTTGVFQLESSGMKDLLTRLRPATFDDVIALVALYRPGPLDSGMVDDFVDRKHGRKPVEYLTPELEPILKETYGVIVYQEQVMKISGTLAKYSMAEADGLRKAMGKKIVEIMAQHRDRFVDGSVSNGIEKKTAVQIFDLMEKFGGYGFNKSHSAAYALIAYQTGYLKAHFPVEFMASLLTSEMHSTDAVVKYIEECRKHDITVLPPDINESMSAFSVSDGKIRFGLVAVKNVGEAAIDSIIKERESGPFASLFEFCERVDLKKMNKRVVESLIKCGAFDTLHDNRRSMIAALEDALEHGARVQKEKNDPQLSLFDDLPDSESINRPKLPDIPEWDEKEKLTIEKETLGFYVSGHPLGRFAETLRKFSNADTITLAEKADGTGIRIGGMVTAVKKIMTKKGDPMAFISLEDMHGTVEAVVFTNLFESAGDLLMEDAPILVEARLQKDENSVKLIAENIIPMDRAEELCTAGIAINLDVTKTDREKLIELKRILEKHRGGSRARLYLIHPEKSRITFELPDQMNVRACSGLAREIEALFGYPAVETECKPVMLQMNGKNRKRGERRTFKNGK